MPRGQNEGFIDMYIIDKIFRNKPPCSSSGLYYRLYKGNSKGERI